MLTCTMDSNEKIQKFGDVVALCDVATLDDVSFGFG